MLFRSGNVYLAGNFVDAIQLGNQTLSTSDSLALFLTKISPAGNILWAKKIISRYSTAYETLLKINAAGELVLAGTCDNILSDFDTLLHPFANGDLYLSKFNRADGSLISFLSTGNHGFSWINDLETDAENNILITGGFVGHLAFGAFSMQCTGTTNTFIAKFNSQDQAMWARRVTNSLSSGNAGMHIEIGRAHV